MGNMQRTSRNDGNDFVFDDQYLESNDDPVSVESFKVSTQQDSSEASNIIEPKCRGDKEGNNMYKQFSNSIKKLVKPKYVRLDEVFEDTKEDGENLEEDWAIAGSASEEVAKVVSAWSESAAFQVPPETKMGQKGCLQ